MNDIWNEICYRCQPFFGSNASEKDYENEFVNCLGRLGWLQWKQEINTQVIVPVGHERKRADIVVSKDGIEQFAVEMKRPGHQSNKDDELQLFSYMRMLPHQVKFGLYVGDDIRIYYDEPLSNKLPQLVSVIEFTNDNPKGVELVGLLSKNTYSPDNFQQYCEVMLTLKKDEKRVKEEIAFLHTAEGIQKLKDFIIDGYMANGFEREKAEKIVAELSLSVKDDDSFSPVQPQKRIEVKIPISPTVQKNTNCSSRDYTKYLFNGKLYGKGKLVHAVMAEYVRLHPDSYANLEWKVAEANVCNPSLICPISSMAKKNHIRYYTKEQYLLTSSDNIKFAVCHEWGKMNIGPFIAWARKQGFEITPQQ